MEEQKEEDKEKMSNGLIPEEDPNLEEKEELLGAILQLDNIVGRSVSELAREQRSKRQSGRNSTTSTALVSPLNKKGEIVRGDKVRYIHIYYCTSIHTLICFGRGGVMTVKHLGLPTEEKTSVCFL